MYKAARLAWIPLLAHHSPYGISPAMDDPVWAAFGPVVGMLILGLYGYLLMQMGRKVSRWFETVRSGVSAQSSGAADVWLPRGHRIPDQPPERGPAYSAMDYPVFNDEDLVHDGDESDLI